MQTAYHDVWQCLVDAGEIKDGTVNAVTLSVRFFLADTEVPLLAYPSSSKPVVVEITADGSLLCDMAQELVSSAPFFSQKHQCHTILMTASSAQKIYQIAVELTASHEVARFGCLLETFPLGLTPYGQIKEILGITAFTSISRETEKMNEEAALYVKTLAMDNVQISGNCLIIKNISTLFNRPAPYWREIIPYFGSWTDTWVGPITQGTVFTDAHGHRAYEIVQNSLPATPIPIHYFMDPDRWSIPVSQTAWVNPNSGFGIAANYWFRRLLMRLSVQVFDMQNMVMKAQLSEPTFDITGDVHPTDPSSWDSGADQLTIYFDRQINPATIPTIWRIFETQTRVTGLDPVNTTADPRGILAQEASIGVNCTMCLLVLKDDFTFDSDKDLIIPLTIVGNDGQPYYPFITDFFPKGLAVMYPFAYILTYKWIQSPQTTLIDSSIPAALRAQQVTGQGWVMCLERIDMVSGRSVEQILLKSNDYFRFNASLPACHQDWKTYRTIDKNSLAQYSKYQYGQHPPSLYKYPASVALPKKGSGDYPTLAGLASISAQLLTVHNGAEQPWLINPLTGYLESAGFSLHPFTFPSNLSLDSANEIIYTTFDFQGRSHYGSYPFMHLCIGDGLVPTPWSTSLDVQNVSGGQVLIRRAKIRNNLLRDLMTKITLNVPPPEKLWRSDILWLSLTPQDEIFTEPAPVETIEVIDRTEGWSTIFDSWNRFSHRGADQPANATELTSWIYDEVDDRIRSTVNSATYIGFYSVLPEDDYEMLVKVSSNAADNDYIGVVIACYTDEDGREHTLSALRFNEALGGGTNNSWAIFDNFGQNFGVDDPTPSRVVIASDPTTSLIPAASGANWSTIYPNGTWIKVKRKGNLIQAWTTQFDSNIIIPESLLEVDLTDLSQPTLARFNQPCSWGIAAYSQSDAQYTDLDMKVFSRTFLEPEQPDTSVWKKSITFPDHLYPGESVDFWIKIAPPIPTTPEEAALNREPLVLYFDAVFNRQTILHGYQTMLSAEILGY